MIAVLFMAAMLASMPQVMDVGPGETVRVLKVDQWRALESAGGPTYTLARLAFCEGGIDPETWRMDVDGTPSVGTFQVKPQFWGEVPSDLAGQAAQAARIIERYGVRPWSARDGCEGWNR